MSLDFRPLPFLGNRHLQTVLGHWLPGSVPHLAGRLHQVVLPDGDRLAVHETRPPDWQPARGTVLLLHGLGGCHRSGYMRRLASLLLRSGQRVLRMDLRGVGAGEALARRTYHGGCSSDARAVVLALHQGGPLVLLGASLGGNIALKLAGESATAPLPGLAAVAALGPPIDLVRCAELLARPGNRLYEKYFVHHLVLQVRRHRRHFPDLPRRCFPRHLTMRLFDEIHTALTWGFANALDYYRRASSLPYIPLIQVPAFILSARDDPFIAVESFEDLRPGPATEVHLIERGGHLGFLGADGTGGFRWAERRVVDWIRGLLACHREFPGK